MPPQPPSPTTTKQSSSGGSSGSSIPLWEWALVLLFAISVDIGQFLIDTLVFGVFVNWLADIFIGMLLSAYFWYRGIKPTWGKFLIQTAFTGVEALGDGALPFWWLDVVIMFLADKTDRVAHATVDKLGGKSDLAT